MNRDPRMQVVSTSDNVVRLYLSGSGTLIGSMRADQVRVKLDLSMAKNGENRFPITNDSIVIPPGVRLNRIEPSEIKLVLDIPVAKTLPVQVDWVDALPENLIMESLKVKPEKVTVEGPGHLLSGMDTLYTQPVSLRGLADSGQLGALLALETPTVKVAPDSSDEVQIRYTIHERAGQNVQQP
jgi:YbbR domain-containing protein